MDSSIIESGQNTVPNRGLSQKKNEKKIANSVDPDEKVNYEPSHKDLHYLHWYLYGSTGLNRKEGNDQESIQLHNTFRPRRQRGRRTHLKQGHNNQNTTSRKLKGQFLFQKLAKRLSKILNYTRTIMQRHTIDSNSKPQQKHRLGTVSSYVTEVGWGGGA